MTFIPDVRPTRGAMGQVPGAYAQLTGNSGSIGTTAIVVPGLAFTVTVPAGRRFRYHGNLYCFGATANMEMQIQLRMDGATVGLGSASLGGTASRGATVKPEVLLTSDGNSHAYTVFGLASAAATFIISGNPAYPAFVMLEDIGLPP